jgi:hypothetical protein
MLVILLGWYHTVPYPGRLPTLLVVVTPALQWMSMVPLPDTYVLEEFAIVENVNG